MKNRKGFTIIELVLVIGIIAILSVVSLIGLSGRKNKTELDGATKQITALLREAQSKSVSQINGSAWGVHFENSTATAPFYALFSGLTYASTSATSYYRLSAKILYATSSIALGAAKDIAFSQISGFATATSSVVLYVSGAPNISSTIAVGISGAVN